MVTKILQGRWLDLMLCAFGILAIMATVHLTLSAIVPLSITSRLALEAGTACLVVFCIARWDAVRLRDACAGLRLPSLTSILLAGTVVRIAWAVIFQPQPSSDGASYVALAHQLLDHHSYGTPDAQAYWPPGYAFYLAVFFSWLPQAVAILVAQLAAFVAACVGVHRLAGDLGGDRAARMAAGLLAVWPNLVAHAGSPDKEMLVLALLVWWLICLRAGSARALLGAGVLCGIATLVQPSTQFLVLASLAYIAIVQRRRAIPGAMLLILGAALVIAPWTARNYAVFGQWKLVSTNGGDNLYRANNPLATGGYTDHGAIDLSGLSELERDQAGKRLAVDWIQSHPPAFAALSLEKQHRFMGDDSVGVYSTFRSLGENRNARVYAPLKALANLWWLAAWLLLAALAWRRRIGPAALLVWVWLYFYTLHAVFESNGKYHEPVLWVLCVLLGVLLAGERGQHE